MAKRAIRGLLPLLAFLLLAFPVPAGAATPGDIPDQVICQCGCASVLSSCTHAECGSRKAMTDAIALGLEQDKTPKQIIAAFVTRYGEQVLASPPKRGFNLTAWILPFIAIVAGGGVVYLSLKKWVLKGKEVEVKADSPESDEYLHRVDEELADFSERSFR